MSICFDIIPNRGFWGLINSPMFWELKSNDCLKVDGRKVDVLLLGLRNGFYLHQNKFSACKSADDCKQFFCAFCT